MVPCFVFCDMALTVLQWLWSAQQLEMDPRGGGSRLDKGRVHDRSFRGMGHFPVHIQKKLSAYIYAGG